MTAISSICIFILFYFIFYSVACCRAQRGLLSKLLDISKRLPVAFIFKRESDGDKLLGNRVVPRNPTQVNNPRWKLQHQAGAISMMGNCFFPFSALKPGAGWGGILFCPCHFPFVDHFWKVVSLFALQTWVFLRSGGFPSLCLCVHLLLVPRCHLCLPTAVFIFSPLLPSVISPWSTSP